MALLRWWLIFLASISGMITLQFFGLLQKLYEVDATKLSFVVIALYFTMTVFVGYLTFKLINRNQDFHKKYIAPCWFASDLLMGMGICGTLIGSLLLFSSALVLTNTSADNIKEMLTHLTHGTSTLLTVTLSGFITSFLLKGQLVLLEMDLPDDFT